MALKHALVDKIKSWSIKSGLRFSFRGLVFEIFANLQLLTLFWCQKPRLAVVNLSISEKLSLQTKI